MGDSITQYGKDSAAGYLPLVAKGLEANGVTVTWHGVGTAGNTAAQMRARFEKDALSKDPDVVTILAGVNDCSQGWPNNTASTPNDVEEMVKMTINAGATPVVNTIEPFYNAKVAVKVSDAEYLNIRVAAAKAGKPVAAYQRDLLLRGLDLISQTPAELAEASGASIDFSAAEMIGFVDYDRRR